MKKVIEGALYNTETAKEIGAWDNGLYGRDFGRCSETLYRTKSGKYFLHGDGGPMSKYAVRHGNSTSGSEEIRPYTPAEAAEWAEEHLTADEYAAEFGEPEEAADGREALNISIPAELKRRFEQVKKQTGKSISQQIVDKFAE